MVTTATASARLSTDRIFGVVLLAYLALVTGFHRGFAHLHVPTPVAPLYSGELAIAVLGVLFLVSVWRRRRLPFRLGAADWLLLAFLAVGTVYAARGVLAGYGVAALRDFALVYYAVFYLFARTYFATGQPLLGPVWALSVGATAGAAMQTWSFLSHPALDDGHGGPGHLALVAWIGLVGLTLLRRKESSRWIRAGWWGAAVVDLFAVYLSGYRTLLGVMAVSLAALALGRVLAPRSTTRGAVRRLAASILAASVIVTVHLAFMPTLSSRLAIDGPVGAADGFGAVSSRWAFRILRPDRQPGSAAASIPRLSGGLAPSWVFRADAWDRAVKKIAGSPLAGIGFGPAPDLFPEILCDDLPGPTSNCGNAHNSYLTLAMRMGLPVLALFVAINVLVAGRFLADLRSGRLEPPARILADFSGAAYLSCLAYACLSLFLESPYLSPVYWVVLGAMTVGAGATPAPSIPGARTRARTTGR